MPESIKFITYLLIFPWMAMYNRGLLFEVETLFSNEFELQFVLPQLIFFVWSYPTCCVASLHAGPVGCISYNMYTVKGRCSFCTFVHFVFCKRRCPTEHFFY